MNMQGLTTEEMQEQIEDYNEYVECKANFENLTFFLTDHEMKELMESYYSKRTDAEFYEALVEAMTTASLRKNMSHSEVM